MNVVLKRIKSDTKMEEVCMDKREISRTFLDIALMLEVKGDNPFKVRAYQNGARIIELLEGNIEDYIIEGKIEGIKGIGEALSAKIIELHNTGKLEFYEKLKSSIPPGLFDILKIPGIGPKTTKVLYEKLGIKTIGELEYACLENRLLVLEGFGEKTQNNILKGIQSIKKFSGQFLYGDVEEIAETIKAKIVASNLVIRCDIAGSLRRKKEIVKDIDMVASSEDADSLMNYFSSLPEVGEIIAKGETKTSVRLKNGISMDIRVVEDSQYPYALHHFTGSKEHNTALRHRAKGFGIKINEYGLFHNDELITCYSEEDIFRELRLQYIPPEIRENNGEIEAAESNKIPKLVRYEDLKGVFHVHTKYSDGSNTILEMAEKAKKMGFSYLGISDHSQSAFYAKGLGISDIMKQLEEIDEINHSFMDFKILKGIEVDILLDGSLDYDDDILSLFDFIIASVHSNLKMDEDKMTMRIINAIKNKYTTMIGHLTGRILLAREACNMDVEAIIEAASKHNKIIEINCDPHRLDLDWRRIKYAKGKGIKFAINPDAHSLVGLKNIRFGVGIARKGWLEASDIINSLDCEKAIEILNNIKD